MSDDVLKKAAAGLMAVRKSPFRTFVGPGPRTTSPDSAVPVAHYEREGAHQQVDEIVTMMGPIRERFQGEEQLIATLNKLVITLRTLIENAPIAKQESVTVAPPRGKRFIRVVGDPLPLRPASRNSIDAIVEHALSRVTVEKKYPGH